MDPAAALGGRKRDRNNPLVLMSHNPDTKDALRSLPWDMMLSGHTHGGQLSLPLLGEPFAPIVDKRYVRDLHRIEDRWLYITAGVGSLHTARFNCRPEISLLTLV
jgi:predicted MPP superfamily phosphohydrolase